MILQVGADAGQVDGRLDAHGAQMIRRADARQHKQLGRVDGAAGEDDVAVGAHRAALAPVVVLDAHGAVALDHHPARQGPGFEPQVGPP